MINNTLDKKIINTLCQIFSKYTSIKQVKLYGSRAKGTHKYYSDIDLVIFGENNFSRFNIADILMEIEESNIPYQVDLQSYADIKNNNLRNHINTYGTLIYQTRLISSPFRGRI